MQTAAFAILWLSLGLYAVLAGADFGIGFWILISHASDRGSELRRDAFAYFSPLWEVNGLFLIFFLMGLLTAFSKAVGVLGRALIPLLLAALVLFVLRSVMYALLHHGPGRSRPAATWGFGVASIAAGVLLGYAAAAPASGYLIGNHLDGHYYASAVGVAAIPLTLAASAHLAALILAAHARLAGSNSADWFRHAATASGFIAFGAAALFTLAILGQSTHIRDRLLGPWAIPMTLAALLAASGLGALLRRRVWLAVGLVTAGYVTGLVSGAFAQLPYLVYPSLTIDAAASPHISITAFVITTAIGGPLLLAALSALYWTTLRPAPPHEPFLPGR